MTNQANTVALGGFRIGRYEVDGKVDAESNMEIAQEWVRRCEASHMECLGTSIPYLPTRVIDVGTQEDWTDLRITHAREKKAPYIVLSHCWGGPVAPMLTSRTIHIFQDQLPFSELPANFRDAITITKRLGFRYLWIDSLCIIQDSREDWTQESKKMGLIYRNSTLAISAMASKSSKHGIIPQNLQVELPLPRPVKVRLSKDSEAAITVLRQDFDEETLRILDIRSPVSNRAWCLQESLLSPRHLYYGRCQIYWRCPAGYQAADGTSSGLRVPEFTFPHVSAVLYRDIRRSQGEALSSVRLLLQDYYTLVENYSQRRLTFSSDKLPAFSGISGRIHPVIGGIYLAGLWTKDLAAGLLWQKEMRTCKHVETYRAPSWSWAVTDESVLFYKKDALPQSSVYIKLIDYRVDLKDETNPYGEITSASITVRGLTLPLIRSGQHFQGYGQQYGHGSLFYDDDPRYADESLNMSKQRLSTAALLFTMEDNSSAYLVTITSSFPGIDCELEIEHSLFTSEEYLALVVCVDEPEDDSIPTAKSVHGLAIKPVHGRGEDEDKTYERVGKFVIPTLEVSRLQAWETRTLTLV